MSRLADDFSSQWSNAREDFERKFYRKRNKVKVRFVELTDTIPIQGPESDVLGKLVTSDFRALLDAKQREIVVLLSSGYRQHEIAERLGYANHSPVSKRLSQIRQMTGASTPRSAPAPGQTFDASKLEPLESIEVTSRFIWLRAGAISLDAGGLPSFPTLPREPGLYRFDFDVDDEGVRTIYIGESVSLRQRASNYRNAKTDRSRQRTSRRIHKEVVTHLIAGGAIEFAIATAVVLADGQPADLRLKSARRLAENAAVLTAQMESGVTVLNIDADLTERDEDGEGDDA